MRKKEGGSAPFGCQAVCLAVRWSKLVCYRVSSAQTGNSVSRQAGATGSHHRLSSVTGGARDPLTFESICVP